MTASLTRCWKKSTKRLAALALMALLLLACGQQTVSRLAIERLEFIGARVESGASVSLNPALADAVRGGVILPLRQDLWVRAGASASPELHRQRILQIQYRSLTDTVELTSTDGTVLRRHTSLTRLLDAFGNLPSWRIAELADGVPEQARVRLCVHLPGLPAALRLKSRVDADWRQHCDWYDWPPAAEPAS